MRWYAALPRSRAFATFRARVKGAIDRGFRRRMLEGKDGRGRAFVPLAASTLRQRAGSGPPLIPRSQGSRFITTYVSRWVEMPGTDERGSATLVWAFVAGWSGFVSRTGFAIPIAHILGARRGAWILPKRNATGIDPKTWVEVDAFDRQFLRDVTEGR